MAQPLLHLMCQHAAQFSRHEGHREEEEIIHLQDTKGLDSGVYYNCFELNHQPEISVTPMAPLPTHPPTSQLPPPPPP